MNIEDTLKNPWGCYQAGAFGPDEEFEAHKNGIVEGVSQSARLSYRAGKDWSLERFLPFAETFARKITQEVNLCLETGRNWSDKRFLPVAEIIAHGVVQRVDLSYDAGSRWSNEKFYAVAEILAEGVAKDPDWSHQAINYWAQERTLRVKETLAKGVSGSLKFSYFVKNWSEWKQVEEIVEKDPFWERIITSERKYTSALLNFSEHCDHQLLTDFPLENLYEAADLFRYARKKGKEELFLKSFSVVLDRGQVRPWLDEIQNRLRGNAIGGDTYRGVAV
mgnify:CR=1 FL=1|jgi:hypothetical protein